MEFLSHDFKTIQLTANFVSLDVKELSVYRFLVPKLLTSQTDILDNKTQFNARLEALYGAYFQSKIERLGHYSIITITMTIIDPKIVDDPDLLSEALSLFHDVLYQKKAFSSKLFEEEKRLLIEQWESLSDKKRQYANQKFTEFFYENDQEGHPISGTLEDIKSLSLNQMIEYYQHEFLKNPMIVICCGNFDELQKNQINQSLNDQNLTDFEDVIFSFRPLGKVRMLEEKTQMKQAIIKMGYHFPIFRNDEMYWAALLVDTILGGYPDSRLFKEIREKKGLCYDVSSNYHPYKGTLHISLGVDAKNREIAVDEVKKLINSLKKNGFTENELHYAKGYLIHQLKMSVDHQTVLTKRALLKMFFHDTDDINTRIALIDSITLDQLNQSLQLVNLDTVYILHGGAND
jgi:predicted Zn-dependent peptidase